MKLEPGRSAPPYSHRTETKAHLCCFMPESVRLWKVNSSNTLQNHTVSIVNFPPLAAWSGGRTNTRSWRLGECFRPSLCAKGYDITRCTPSFSVWPITSPEYS